ncbi:MAG: SlyX family protein [Opitutales bacterium]
MDGLTQLQERITHLEKHIAEQDSEIYQQCRRTDALVRQIQKLELRLASLEQGGRALPPDEKPPHY